jgi:hypothetical protein
LGTLVKFPQIGACAETSLHLTVDDECMGIGFQGVERCGEFLQFSEGQRAQFIARRAVKRKLDDTAYAHPRKCLTFELLHA